ETTGLRATLNFGHTVGHALEQMTGYREFLHGEAISIGMVVESYLGEKLGLTRQGTTQNVQDFLSKQGLPVASELLKDTATLIEVMKRDKKAGIGELAFSLLTQIGACKLIEGVPSNDVESALNEL
ncbi:MAG: 3-dehydroquinate synthase, partial [Chlorobia bacterium]|nr:3-dehydroquinate synthase [Fimbriimonadaceae bacterium]